MNISGSLNGGVVYQPASFSKMTGGFRHSSIVVQMLNDGAKISLPVGVAHDEVRAVARAQLVELAEQVVGGVAGEDIAEAGFDAHADQGQPARASPSRRRCANWSSPSFTPVFVYGSVGCGSDRLIAMSR